jgi:regulatory protein
MHPQEETEQNSGNQFAKVRRKALDLLARRDHAGTELKLKLIKKGYNQTVVDEVIKALETSGLINAARLAESYTHFRRQKGFGPRRIAMELQAKGVDEAVIAEQVKITDNAWLIDIRALWNKHFKGRQPADKLQRARQLRFLHNRGFTQNQINSLFKNSEELDE